MAGGRERRRLRRNASQMKTYLVGFAVGALALTALNHLRWAIFPMSGGPVGINRWLGGPPDREGPLVRVEPRDS